MGSKKNRFYDNCNLHYIVVLLIIKDPVYIKDMCMQMPKYNARN